MYFYHYSITHDRPWPMMVDCRKMSYSDIITKIGFDSKLPKFTLKGTRPK